MVNISTIQQPDQINIPAEGSNGGGEYYDPLEGRVALGSGFIISEDGYIITNYHVIENAEVVNVVLFDNTEVEADIIGGDEKTDIALIKIEPPFELDKVTFGDSDAIRVGDWVLAIGQPVRAGRAALPPGHRLRQIAGHCRGSVRQFYPDRRCP